MNESTLVPREKLSDLDWLARNVHVWPTSTPHIVPPGDSVFEFGITFFKNHAFMFRREYTHSKVVYKKQWLARRAELQNKPSWDDFGKSAKFMAQDSDGAWRAFESEPTAQSLIWNAKRGWRGYAYEYTPDDRGEVLGDWRDTLEKRPEQKAFEQSKPDANGWIEWCGGECPVGEDDLIDVKFSDGDSLFGVDSAWDWSYDADICNIIAYRLHKPEPEIQSEIMGIAQVNDINVVESKPTIEQLAADYRNRKDFADRKQQEADAAKADAEAKLAELVAAGKALGLVLAVAGLEPEMMITDWRDLQVGDVVWYGGDDELPSGEYHVMEIEAPNYVGYRTVMVNGVNGGHWIDTCAGWGFIRRPT